MAYVQMCGHLVHKNLMQYIKDLYFITKVILNVILLVSRLY